MTFSNEFIDIAKKEFNIDVDKLSTTQLRNVLEGIFDENQMTVNNLIGCKYVDDHIKISKELNNKLYLSKKLYSEFMDEFNK